MCKDYLPDATISLFYEISHGYRFKAGMAHSDRGWTCEWAGKTVRSLENTCHTWALLRWWFTKRRYIKCTYLYLYLFVWFPLLQSNTFCVSKWDSNPCWFTGWKPSALIAELLLLHWVMSKSRQCSPQSAVEATLPSPSASSCAVDAAPCAVRRPRPCTDVVVVSASRCVVRFHSDLTSRLNNTAWNHTLHDIAL